MIPQWFMDTAGQVALLLACGLLVVFATLMLYLLIRETWRLFR